MSNILLIIFPLIILGIFIIILIKFLTITNSKGKLSTTNLETIKKENAEENYMSLGLTLGMCLGGALGLIFQNLFSLNLLTYGTFLGMLIGMLIGMSIKKEK